uniref:Glycosyltransferase n=2 Tax=Cajanus cajan TaxID=3821 RepID=A0A151TRJ8_CAJCA|nr:Anthocyanidin 5,3-O-glucosyltransferase [Cajanus cajan]
MKEAIVFYPAPLIGHLISIVELCKLILTHQPSLSLHMLITTPPYDTSSTSNYISTISATLPSITFHNLPTFTPPHTLLSSTLNHETLLFHLLHHNHPHIHQTLISISKTHTIQALILDILCSQSLSIASQLNLPAYIFVPFGASGFSSFLYLPTLHDTYNKSFKELNIFLNIPGVPPMPTCDMPKPMLERNDESYKSLLNCSLAAPKAAGYIVNTFEAFEASSIKAISNGLALPNSFTPPLYCVGPIVSTTTNQYQNTCDHECLRWMDSQPSKSVVFLCFGSLGVFSREQLREIALGLEKSGQRFLWVVRNPINDQNHNLALGIQEDPDLESLLPKGFLDRTKGKGLVVKNWAPQVAVLSHNSVGGFVSHCGWNSVLEAVCGGVPMIAWPLYAEQRFNRVVVVEAMEVALWMHENAAGFVAASEVEERVRELMESERGKQVRIRVGVAKDEAKAALMDGGSSHVALEKLLKSWNGQVS